MLKNKKSVLLLIFLLAFTVRAWFIFEHSSSLMGDEIEYDQLATSVINGQGYVNQMGHQTAARPPGYPLFLSLAYLLVGKNYFIIRFIQVFLDSSLCVLIYYLGRAMFTENVGLLAALLGSIHLGFIAQPAKILTEGLSTLFLLAGIIFFYKARKNPLKRIYYVFCGFILGSASLIRANLLIISVFIAGVFIYDLFKKGLNSKQVSKYILIYALAFILPILPWTIRNYKVFNTVVPISTLQGIALYTSYNPKDGKIYGFTPRDAIIKEARSMSSEVEESKFLTKKTIELLKANPGLFFKLLGLKMAYLFSPFDWELIRDRVVYNYLYVFCLPFFIMGSFIFLRRFNEFLPLYLPILAIIITSAIFFGIPRFRVVVEPYTILLAAASIIYFYKKIHYKRYYLMILCVFFLSNFMFYLNSSFLKLLSSGFLKKIGVW